MKNASAMWAMLNGVIGTCCSLAFLIFYVTANPKLDVALRVLGRDFYSDTVETDGKFTDVMFDPPDGFEVNKLLLLSFASVIIASGCGLIGLFLLCCKKSRVAAASFVVATIFSGVAFVYFAVDFDTDASDTDAPPLIGFVFEQTAKLTFMWGPGVNIGAIVNHLFAALNCFLANTSKPEKSGGGGSSAPRIEKDIENVAL